VSQPGQVERIAAVALARAALGVAEDAVVYVDRTPRDPGTVAVGPVEVHADHSTLLVFRDEQPGANWMHACTYALVDLESGEILATAPADRPPRFGALPDTWIVASDPAGCADLLPSDHHQEEET
jgi:hypothetical protein